MDEKKNTKWMRRSVVLLLIVAFLIMLTSPRFIEWLEKQLWPDGLFPNWWIKFKVVIYWIHRALKYVLIVIAIVLAVLLAIFTGGWLAIILFGVATGFLIGLIIEAMRDLNYMPKKEDPMQPDANLSPPFPRDV